MIGLVSPSRTKVTFTESPGAVGPDRGDQRVGAVDDRVSSTLVITSPALRPALGGGRAVSTC